MSTYSSTYAGNISTNANWQAAVSTIDTEITNRGWVVTTDTGQMTPATATAPTAANTLGGYRIYKTNDSFTTIYLRVEYWRGTSTSLRLDLMAGWSTDGAGNITGNKTNNGNSISLNVSTAQTGNTDIDIGGSTGWLTVILSKEVGWPSTLAFTIGRDLDSSGAEVGSGFNIMASSQQSYGQQYVPSSGFVPPWQGFWVAPHPTNATTAVIGANTLFSFPIPVKATGGGNPVIAAAVFTNTDVGPYGAVVSLSPYGTAHNYLTIANLNAIAGSNNFHGMFRFE